MPQRIEPVSDDMKAQSDAKNEAAIALIRQKVARALGEEPSAAKHISASIADKTPSRHQLYMRELAASGKSLAEIQTEWHRYYTMLSDADKQQVWDEFYENNQKTPYQTMFRQQAPTTQLTPTAPQPPPGTQPLQTTPTGVTVADHQPLPPPVQPRREIHSSPMTVKTEAIKHRIKKTVRSSSNLKAKHHLQSALFGLGIGALVLFVMLFGFFNEMVLAPFIQPSRKAIAETPIISTTTVAETAAPTIIVPKINIQIPIDFEVPSIDEATVQESLNGGVVHYPSTALPGQNGNGAYFGHSSQNVFNNGKYKYAFVLLHRLTTGDVFSIVYKGKVYYYQVFAREIVPPTQVSVLNDTKGKLATAALITCDPPGFSTNRLVVWGEQISPSVGSNTAAPIPDASLQPAEITDKGPSAWERLSKTLQFWRREE